jgi:DNA mismatch repair protein MutS2
MIPPIVDEPEPENRSPACYRNENPNVDEFLLKKIQFHKIQQALVDRCACALGKQLARKLKPANNQNLIQRWLDQVAELESASEKIGLPPLGGVRDVRLAVVQSGVAPGLDADALATIAETLQATGALRRWIDSLPESHAELATIGNRVADLTFLANQISQAVDERGRVRDTASPRLASLRSTIDKTTTQIDIVLNRILKQSRVQRMLQYPNATFHNDRMVLPLKSEHRGRVPGIVHRTSDSGATIFVEPSEAVALNNTIISLREDERQEIGRILSALSRVVHENEDAIRSTLDAMAVFDLVRAKVEYAKSRAAICPEIADDNKLDLVNAKHPVLIELFAEEAAESKSKEPRSVVPIDVRLGEDFDVLVVTGPNTGGKTVALKTIALMAVMTQAGIPIPAGPGARMPVFKRIFFDVGDEQSLEQSLSTFSGHMSNILKMLQRADEHSLVLIDELGAGTDPDEGAAIGRAVLDELVRMKCLAVVTTHLSNLKAVAYTTDRVDNASVLFDVASLKPTYELRLGEPGNSNAITIAQRLGMPKRLVESARNHLDNRYRALSDAIAGTLQSRRDAEEARKSAREAGRQAEEFKQYYQEESAKLAEAQEEYDRWIHWVNGLTPGDEVHVKTFETNAKVIRMHLHRQTAVVSSGAMDFEVKLRDLTIPQNE